MQPQIIHQPPLVLIGLSFYGDPFQLNGAWTEENEIGRLWQRFMGLWSQQPGIFPPLVQPGVTYEIHILHPESQERGEHEVFVGMQAAQPQPVSAMLSYKLLPESQYALFTLAGQQIIEDWWNPIVADWLPTSGYAYDAGFSIQRYDERFKSIEQIDESELDILIPIHPQ